MNLLSATDKEDALFLEGILEAGIESRRCWSLVPLALEVFPAAPVLRQGDVDECQVHVNVRVFLVLPPKALSGVLEPASLTRLDPVVTSELAFIGRIRVSIKEIEGKGRVRALAAVENFDYIVSDSVNVFGASCCKRVGKVFVDSHELCSVQVAFIVVIAENDGVGDLAVDQELDALEDCALGVGCCLSVHLVSA